MDGLLPQHLKDLIGPAAEEGALSVLNALTALTTLILEGRTPAPICPLLFGAKLTTALTKERGDIHPIAVGVRASGGSLPSRSHYNSGPIGPPPVWV